MFCPNCGTKVQDNARFCFSCGFKLESIAAEISSPSQSDIHQTMPSVAKEKEVREENINRQKSAEMDESITDITKIEKNTLMVCMVAQMAIQNPAKAKIDKSIFLKGDYKKHFDNCRHLERSANEKNGDRARLQCVLGDMFTWGVGTKINMDRAIEYLQYAAKAGHPVAMNHLGDIYRTGINGVEQNDERAYYFYRLALDHNPQDTEAQNVIKDYDNREDSRIMAIKYYNYDEGIYHIPIEAYDITMSVSMDTAIEVNQRISEKLAVAIERMNEFYSEAGDIDSVIAGAYDYGKKLLLDIGKAGAAICAETKMYDISAKRLTEDLAHELARSARQGTRIMNEGFYAPVAIWEKYFKRVQDAYQGIVFSARAERDYREQRKENRGRVIGGGFGLDNAIKGMIQAGAINMLTGAAHSAFNTIGNWGTDRNEMASKEALYADRRVLNTLISGLAEAANVLKIRTMAVVGCEVNQEKCLNILESVKSDSLDDESAVKLALLNAFNADPFQLDVYRLWMERFGDENFEWQDAAVLFGLGEDVRYIKDGMIKKHLSKSKQATGVLIDMIANNKTVEQAYIEYDGSVSQALSGDLLRWREAAQHFGVRLNVPSYTQRTITEMQKLLESQTADARVTDLPTDYSQKQVLLQKIVVVIKQICDAKKDVSVKQTAGKTATKPIATNITSVENSLVISSKQVDFKDFVRGLWQEYSFGDGGLYFVNCDKKAGKKIIGATNAYAKQAINERVICCYDDTLFGGADDGFLLTDKRLYIHNFREDAINFPLASINAVSVVNINDKGEKERFGVMIDYGGSTPCSIRLTSASSEKAASVKAVIENVCAYFKAADTGEQDTNGSQKSINTQSIANTDALSTNTARNAVDLPELIRKLQQQYGEVRNVFWAGAGSKATSKIGKAMYAYAPNETGEDVLLCLDDTVFGGAEDGCLVTATKIYIHNGDTQMEVVPWNTVKDITIKKGFMSDSIILHTQNSNMAKSVTLDASTLGSKDKKKLVSILQQIQQELWSFVN